MSRLINPHMIAVSVATIWTSPASPREIDLPALRNPVLVREWLSSMSVEDRLQLHDRNAVQTQALYGTLVEVVEEQGEWVQIAIPSQLSGKDRLGYPGWMPKCQIVPANETDSEKTDDKQIGGAQIAVEESAVKEWDGKGNEQQKKKAMMTSKSTFLYRTPGEKGMEVFFLTELPVLGEEEEWVSVATPHGPQLIRTEDAVLYRTDEELRPAGGQDIVETGKRFLGLPYLWGGMSSLGYDCSGFAYSMHRAHGIIIPRDAGEQAKYGWLIDKENLQPGDLLFFAYEKGKGAIHHVGIYAGNGIMLHSPKTGKSIELLPLAGTVYEEEYCLTRRYW
ncbi:C40 family peptidase [Aneurinibacillus terranovensis]|uniref:C40 family peptidase n=1 Tax=Aneurinibacillus terranovensis TaxID=278991 RepID=UPI0003F93CEE|nr:C40 family peptidase [Aneurinibacillus terranovensis]